MCFFYTVMHLNGAHGMTNSVDPDQTAPSTALEGAV